MTLSTSFDDLASLLGWHNLSVGDSKPDSSQYSIGLISGFDLRLGGRPIGLSDSSSKLIAMLAVSDRPVGRAIVAGRLWEDSNDEKALACLRSALWRIRSFASGLVETSSTQLRLAPGVNVDLRTARQFANDLITSRARWTDGDLELFQGGDLLTDWLDEWVLVERESFRQLRLHALELACEQLAGEGQFARAIVAGLEAVKAEPLRESAHRALIGAHLAEGNANEALRQYELYRELLHRELGLSPSRAISDLVTCLGSAD